MIAMRRVASSGRESWGSGPGEASERPGLVHLYATYSALILAHCTRLLRERAWAEDATHDVFLRVQRHADRLPESAEVRPWLFRVATNHCLNELRNRNVRIRDLPHTDEARDNEDALAARNDARRFLEQLPPRARAVAWLTFVDGMLQREVAQTLRVSRRTVVAHLTQVRSRALAAL